ncbi:MAG: response regulator [Candidatus Margulisbacteria bacterium]|nr:response regulator [Candidatus Margulisiibacteriota bacterium]
MENKKSILIVDDEKNLSELVARRLAYLGYQTYTSNSPEKVVRIAEDKKPSLILLDVTMPKISGLEVCQKIRGSKKIKNTPVIFISGKATVEDKAKGLACGAKDYLTKPFDFNELEGKVNKYLGRK